MDRWPGCCGSPLLPLRGSSKRRKKKICHHQLSLSLFYFPSLSLLPLQPLVCSVASSLAVCVIGQMESGLESCSTAALLKATHPVCVFFLHGLSPSSSSSSPLFGPPSSTVAAAAHEAEQQNESCHSMLPCIDPQPLQRNLCITCRPASIASHPARVQRLPSVEHVHVHGAYDSPKQTEAKCPEAAVAPPPASSFVTLCVCLYLSHSHLVVFLFRIRVCVSLTFCICVCKVACFPL